MSITESKHIKAVKEPWHDSNRNELLEQIIQKNVRLGKIAAARVDFGARGMLDGNVRRAAYKEVGFYRPRLHVEKEDEAEMNDVEKVKAYNEGKLVIDMEDIDSEPAPVDIVMAKRVCVSFAFPLSFSHTIVSESRPFVEDLSDTSELPQLEILLRRFLYDLIYPDPPSGFLLLWCWRITAGVICRLGYLSCPFSSAQVGRLFVRYRHRSTGKINSSVLGFVERRYSRASSKALRR